MPDEPIVSEFDRHEGDQSWIDEGDELYEDMVDQLVEDYGSDVMDQYAIDLLYSGWYDPDISSYERAGFWFEFFDYTGINWNDFDWDAWREWYES